MDHGYGNVPAGEPLLPAMDGKNPSQRVMKKGRRKKPKANDWYTKRKKKGNIEERWAEGANCLDNAFQKESVKQWVFDLKELCKTAKAKKTSPQAQAQNSQSQPPYDRGEQC